MWESHVWVGDYESNGRVKGWAHSHLGPTRRSFEKKASNVSAPSRFPIFIRQKTDAIIFFSISKKKILNLYKILIIYKIKIRISNSS